jgi:hypothetical protein
MNFASLRSLRSSLVPLIGPEKLWMLQQVVFLGGIICGERAAV